MFSVVNIFKLLFCYLFYIKNQYKTVKKNIFGYLIYAMVTL